MYIRINKLCTKIRLALHGQHVNLTNLSFDDIVLQGVKTFSNTEPVGSNIGVGSCFECSLKIEICVSYIYLIK